MLEPARGICTAEAQQLSTLLGGLFLPLCLCILFGPIRYC